MGKKITKTPPSRRPWLLVVRNVDLGTWQTFKRVKDIYYPEKKLGPFLEEAMREKIAQHALK